MRFTQPISSRKGADFDALVGESVKELQSTSVSAGSALLQTLRVASDHSLVRALSMLSDRKTYLQIQTWATSTARRTVTLVIQSIESRLEEPSRLRTVRRDAAASATNGTRSATSDAMNLILSSAVQQVKTAEFRSSMVGWAEGFHDEGEDTEDEYENENRGFLSADDVPAPAIDVG